MLWIKIYDKNGNEIPETTLNEEACDIAYRTAQPGGFMDCAFTVHRDTTKNWRDLRVGNHVVLYHGARIVYQGRMEELERRYSRDEGHEWRVTCYGYYVQFSERIYNRPWTDTSFDNWRQGAVTDAANWNAEAWNFDKDRHLLIAAKNNENYDTSTIGTWLYPLRFSSAGYRVKRVRFSFRIDIPATLDGSGWPLWRPKLGVRDVNSVYLADIWDATRSGTVGYGYVDGGGGTDGVTNAPVQYAYYGGSDDAGGQIGNVGGANYKQAQSFDPSSSMTAGYACARLRANTGSPTGTITLRVETSAAGVPSGTLVHANATGTFTPTESAWNYCFFNGTFSVNNGTTYWLVAQPTDAQTSGNYWNWSYDNTSSAYAAGQRAYYDGSEWAATNTDCNFEVGPLADQQISSSSAHFQSWGVAAGDVIEVLEAPAYRYTVQSVSSETLLVVYPQPAAAGTGLTYYMASGVRNLDVTTFTSSAAQACMFMFYNDASPTQYTGDSADCFFEIDPTTVSGEVLGVEVHTHTSNQALYADEIIKDIIRPTVVGSAYDLNQVSSDVTQIGSPGLQIKPAVWLDDRYAHEVVEEISALGDDQTPPRRWYLAVWDKEGATDGMARAYFTAKDTTDYDWTIEFSDLVELELTSTGEKLATRVWASYTDAAGDKQWTASNEENATGPEGYGYRDAVVASQSSSAVTALVARDLYLDQHSTPQYKTRIVVCKPMLDKGGNLRPLAHVRAGQRVKLINYFDEPVLYVQETEYTDGDPPTLTISVEGTTDLLEMLFDRLAFRFR